VTFKTVMPRRRGKRNNKGRRTGKGRSFGSSTIQGNSPSSEGVVVARANGWFTASLSGTPTFLTLSTLVASGFSTRLQTLGELFEQCRCVDLQLTFFATGGDVFMAYIPFEAAVPATTTNDILEMPNVSVLFNGQTVPSRLTVMRQRLLSYVPLKWFPTKQTSGTTSFDQGQIVMGASASITCRIQFQMVFEFCTPVALGNERALPKGFSKGFGNESYDPIVEVKEIDDVVEVKNVDPPSSPNARLAQPPRLVNSKGNGSANTTRLAWKPP
jgi:hypothetical protein